MLPPETESLRVTVKFVDDLRARAAEDGAISLTGEAVPEGLAAIIAADDLRFRSSFRCGEESLRRFELAAEQSSGKAQPDFAGILELVTDELASHEVIRVAKDLYALDCIEFVTVAGPDRDGTPPGDIAPPTPDHRALETWRSHAPGMDIEYAWSYLGQGQRVGVVDIEKSFNGQHEDLVDVTIQDFSTGSHDADDCSISHGTSSLAVLAAPDNGYGVTGGATKSRIGFVSHSSIPDITIVEAIVTATDNLSPGDVILLEIQLGGIVDPIAMRVTGFLPAELDESNHMAISTAVDAGYIVVEAAGNGSENLDASVFDTWRTWGDSGAILVGAGTNDIDHHRLDFSNFGIRVDLHAWGERVYTASTGSVSTTEDCTPTPDDLARHQSYKYFGGTSSASAVTATVAVCVQSFHEQRYGFDLSPATMRDLLKNSGLPTLPGGPFGNIGKCVNARNAIITLVGSTFTPKKFGESPALLQYDFANSNPLSTYPEWEVTEEAGGARVDVADKRLELTSTSLSGQKISIADIHVNLDSARDVLLTIDYDLIGNETFDMPELDSYTGMAEADGVFVSNGSATWRRVPFPEMATFDPRQGTATFTASLDAVVEAAGIAYNSDMRIRFQRFGSSPIGIAPRDRFRQHHPLHRRSWSPDVLGRD